MAWGSLKRFPKSHPPPHIHETGTVGMAYGSLATRTRAIPAVRTPTVLQESIAILFNPPHIRPILLFNFHHVAPPCPLADIPY